MRKLYLGLALGMIALGLVHIAATTQVFHELTSSALWFFSGGLALVLNGTLNLLNRAYGRAAPGVRIACILANIVMAAFTILSGVVGHASVAALLVVGGLMVGAAALSMLPGALLAPRAA